MLTDRAGIARAAADQLARMRKSGPIWNPLPHQLPPPGDWYGWLILAGRGAGKTAACANYMVEHAKGPACLPGPTPHWMGIIAPTQGDAATACYYGPSGIRAYNPDVRMHISPGGTVLRWPNGSEAKLFGASDERDVDKLRAGGNRCLQWLEEFASWRYIEQCWNHMRFGLRAGSRPHWIGSTTPKVRPLIKSLNEDRVKYPDVVVSHATTDDNPHLPSHIKQSLYDAYANTSLGDQELKGLILGEDKNAFWTRLAIAENRIAIQDAPPFTRTTVSVDPSGGAGEQGIIVGSSYVFREKGQQVSKHGYTRDDRTCSLSPDGWGRRAVQAAIDWEADDISVEVNYGGDMAVATIVGAADHLGVSIPVRTVRASTGKQVRAQPVAALAAQGRWHHVGTFPELEDQLCTWTPELGWSPDRLDAMVWTAWHNKVVSILRSTAGGKFGGTELAAAKLG